MKGDLVVLPLYRRALLLGYCLGVALLTGTWVAAQVTGHEYAFFSREPAAALGGVWYAGILSNLGVLVWAAGAAASLLTWLVLRRVDARTASPFLWAGVITTVLLCDDFLQIHDGLLYDVGIGESFVYAVYGAALATFVVRFRWFLGPQGLVVVALAGVLFGVSLLFDAVLPGRHLQEDGAKLLAVVTWSALFVTESLRALAPGSILGVEPSAGR